MADELRALQVQYGPEPQFPGGALRSIPMDTFACPHHPTCPGCPFLGLSYEEQLLRKDSAARLAFADYADLAGVEFMPPVGATPRLGYRTRLKWVASGPRLGLFERGTHRVVDTPGCVVAQPILLEVGTAVRKLLVEERHSAVAEGLTAVDLRQVRAAAERVLVTLVIREDRAPPAGALEAFASALTSASPPVASVGWTGRSHFSPQVLGHGGAILVGEESALDRIGSVDVVARPGSFVQAHRGQAAAIEALLVDALAALTGRLGRKPRVLELFAGSGALGLALAKAGASVTAVESFAPAAQAIGRAAAHASVDVAWHAGDAETFVREHARERFDLAVVDPPRRGLPPSLRAGLAHLGLSELFYVSCAPATLARDLADLARQGLTARRVLPLDMFPMTDHVEAVAFVTRAEPPRPRVLFEDDDLLCVDKPPHEPMRELARRLDASGVTPLTKLPAFVSGPVLFAKDRAASDLPTLEIQRTVRIEAHALVKGVASAKGSVGRPLREHPDAPRTRYQRARVVGGHSLVRVATHGAVEVPMTHLSMIGHPVVGDPKRCDEPTRRHFFEKHGLDRAHFWVASVSFEIAGRLVTVEGSEPPDLRAVTASLES